MAVTLVPASVLVTLGLALFIVGNVFDYPGVAVIGGVVVVGVGAGIVTEGGLSHKVGENRTITNETANETIVDVRAEYEPVQTPLNFPVGTVVMLVGALLVVLPLAEES